MWQQDAACVAAKHHLLVHAAAHNERAVVLRASRIQHSCRLHTHTHIPQAPTHSEMEVQGPQPQRNNTQLREECACISSNMDKETHTIRSTATSRRWPYYPRPSVSDSKLQVAFPTVGTEVVSAPQRKTVRQRNLLKVCVCTCLCVCV